MIKRLMDMQVSVVTIVGWIVAALGLTFSVSSTYGEQKQKLLYLTDKQTQIEFRLDRIEDSIRAANIGLARIETKLEGRK